MQTIATSPTTRRGVLIENLTAVSIAPHQFKELAKKDEELLDRLMCLRKSAQSFSDCSDFADLTKEQLDSYTRSLSANIISRRATKKERADLYNSYGFVEPVEPTTNEPVIWLHPKLDRSVVPDLSSQWKWCCNSYGKWCTRQTKLLILYGEEGAKRSIVDEYHDRHGCSPPNDSASLEVVTEANDLKTDQDGKDGTLMVYDATSSEKMIELINAAIEKEIEVRFMGVGLIDISGYSENRNQDLITAFSKLPESEKCHPNSIKFLVTSEVEAMISLVMEKTKESMKHEGWETMQCSPLWIERKAGEDADVLRELAGTHSMFISKRRHKKRYRDVTIH